MALTKASYALINGAPANVKDFGAVGDGVVNDRAAIQAAFNASKKVFFPSGTYYVGELSGGATAIDLRSLGNDIAIITDGFVELVCNTTNDSVTSFFALERNSHFYCDPIRFRDLGFIPNQPSPSRGAMGFFIQNGNYNWGDLRFIGIYGNNVHSAMTVINVGNTDIASNRVRGIFVDEVFIDSGYYGVNLAANGDGAYFKKIVTSQVFRSLFVYNVTDVEASVFSRNNLSTTGVVNIGWFTNAVAVPKTSAIKVRYVSRDTSAALNHVLINVIGPDLGTIDGVELDLDIEDTGAAKPAVKFVTYTTSGGSETSATLANVVTNVTVRGNTDSDNLITCTANYTTPGRLNIEGPTLYLDPALPANFVLSTISSYTPTWTGLSSNPSLGDGTITGSYSIHDGLCSILIDLEMGSTTTFGTGSWNFSLPFTARSSGLGSVRALDSGTAWFVGTSLAAGNVVDVTFNNTANQASATIPFTWAAGDRLQIFVSYPV